MGMQRTIRMNITMPENLWPVQVVDEIQRVMEAGEANHHPNSWKGLSYLEHVEHAQEHLKAVGHAISHRAWIDVEDHLAHALTCLMMAVAIERGYVKGDTDA